MPKVYVATAFKNLKAAKMVMHSLKELGFTITHDWTHESSEGITGQDLERYLKICGLSDFEGVKDCDLFFLINDERAKGAFTEFGMALALNKPIIAVNFSVADNIFLHIGFSQNYEGINEGLSAAVRFKERWEQEARERVVA